VVTGITITALQPSLRAAQRHALCVVAGRSADHAALQLLGRQVRHLVVGAAQLEAEHRLLVLALEQHVVAQSPRQAAPGSRAVSVATS
jgi:hypothetical protein